MEKTGKHKNIKNQTIKSYAQFFPNYNVSKSHSINSQTE